MDEPTNATILGVDDDEVSRKILERVLTHASFRVFTANSGMSALELLSQIEPSLILLDVMMIKTTGMFAVSSLNILKSRSKKNCFC